MDSPPTIIIMPLWLTDELLLAIAEFLNFNGLRLLCFASKDTSKSLLEEFLAKSHPHFVRYLSRQIMQERIRAPHPEWMTMIIRDPHHLVRFESLDEEETGEIKLFSSDVNDDGKSLAVRISYVSNNEGFSTVVAFTEVTIAPSKKNPMRQGTVSITREHDRTTTTTTEYSDGLDPRKALEWCPLEVPYGVQEDE